MRLLRFSSKIAARNSPKFQEGFHKSKGFCESPFAFIKLFIQRSVDLLKIKIRQKSEKQRAFTLVCTLSCIPVNISSFLYLYLNLRISEDFFAFIKTDPRF